MRTVDSASWVGQLLGGRYQVTAKLGEGGMGFVYQARDRHLDCDVVLKIPRPHLLDDAEFVQRFDREIRSLVRLRHPHIVPISDVGRHDGVPFAVMQYLAGGSLENRLYPGRTVEVVPLSPQHVAEWMPSIAAALDFIHQQGFIHRDIKPGNILFDRAGNAFVSDFGVVKTVTEKANKQMRQLTGTGMVMGTPHYMAPELIMGERCDGRVDQYALAVTIYQVLSGRLPVDGPTPGAILIKQMQEEAPALDQIVRGIPEKLAVVVRQGLAKDPQQRFASCSAFADAVLATLSAVPRHTSTPGERKPRLKPGENRSVETSLVEQAKLETTKARRPRSADARAPSAVAGKRNLILAGLLLGGILLSLTILIVALVGYGSNSLETGVTLSVPANVAGIQVLPIRDVTLKAGDHQRFEVRVQRNGSSQPIQLRLLGLPERVTHAPSLLVLPPTAESIEITVLAAPGVPSLEERIRVQASLADGTTTVESTFLLKVQPLRLRLIPVRSIMLKPGMSHDLSLGVDRDGYTGPINLRLGELPAQVAAEGAMIPSGQATSMLRLTAAADAPAETRQVEVRAWIDEEAIGEPIRFTVTVSAATELRLCPLAAVRVTAGDTHALEIKVERRGCQGEVKIELAKLAGIDVGPVVLAANQDQAILLLKIAPNALVGSRQAHVIARLDQLIAEQRFQITIGASATIQFVKPIQGVDLKPGETKNLTIRIERRGFEGPVLLQVEGLPTAVTAKSATIGVGKDQTTIPITATANALNADCDIQVVAQMIDQKIDTKVRLVVSRPGSATNKLPNPAKRLPQSLREKLKEAVSLEGDFKGTLRDTTKYLGDRYDIIIVIDTAALKRRGVPNADDRQVQLPTLTNVSLLSVLERLAGQVKGVCRIRENDVEITAQ